MQLKARTKRGSNFDNWDIQVKSGFFSKSRGLLTIEEHGANRQYVKFKCRVDYSLQRLVIPALSFITALALVFTQQYILATVLLAVVLAFAIKFLIDTTRSMNSLSIAFKAINAPVEQPVLVINKQEIKAELSEEDHATYSVNGKYHQIHSRTLNEVNSGNVGIENNIRF